MIDVALCLALLQECRDKHVTEKWWDDNTRMHDRISDALGLPRAYPDRGEDYDPTEPVETILGGVNDDS